MIKPSEAAMEIARRIGRGCHPAPQFSRPYALEEGAVEIDDMVRKAVDEERGMCIEIAVAFMVKAALEPLEGINRIYTTNDLRNAINAKEDENG